MRKPLSLLLALVLTLSLCVTAFAGSAAETTVLRLTGDAADQVVNLSDGQRVNENKDLAVRLRVQTDPGAQEYTVALNGKSVPADHSTSRYHFYYMPAKYLRSGETTLSVNNADETAVSIASAEELKAFRDRVNDGETALNAVLTADIALDKTEAWTPMNGYTGTFDGGSHTISGLLVENAAQKAGFISTAGSGAVIRNLTITDSSFSGSNSRIGAFVGYTEGAVTFENCHTAADVSVTGSSGVGGLFGGGNTAKAFITMTNCSNAATVTATGGSNTNGVGGLIGTAPNGTDITGSCNLGKVQATSTSAVATGGLVGASNTGSSKPAKTATLTNVYNTGAVTSAATSTQYVGGLLGNATWGCTISQAYGTMTVQTGSGYGGIITGYVANTVTVSNIYIELIRGQNQNCKAAIFDSAGLLSSAEKMFNDTEMKDLSKLSKLGDAFAEDENSINGGYPVLAWQNPAPAQTAQVTVRVNGLDKVAQLPADGSTDPTKPTDVAVEYTYEEAGGNMARVLFKDLSDGVTLGGGFDSKTGAVTNTLTQLEEGYTGQQLFFYKDPKAQTKSAKVLWTDGDGGNHYYTITVKRAAQDGYVLAPGSGSNESAPGGANAYDAATGCVTGMIKGYAAAPFTYHDLTLFNSGKTTSTTTSPVFPADATALYYLKDGVTVYFARPGRYWVPASVEKDGVTYTGEAPFLAVWTLTILNAQLEKAKAVQTDSAFAALPESVQQEFNAIVDRLTAGSGNMSGNVMVNAKGAITTGDDATDIQARDFGGKQIFTERLLEGDECALMDLMAIFETYKSDKSLGQYQAQAYQKIASLGLSSFTDVTTEAQKTSYIAYKQAKWDLLKTTDLDGINAILTKLGLEAIEAPQVTLGDIDNNGEINMDDVALLIRYCNNLTDLTDTQKAAAELDGNGELNMDDVALLIRYCNNLLSVFPAQK